MSAPQPYDPKKKPLSPEELAMQQPYSMRFPKETGNQRDEQTQKLDNFLRTLKPEKADQSSDTASQKDNTLGSDTLNGRKAKDDIGVSYDGNDSLQRDIKQHLHIEQQNKGFDVISTIMNIDNRLNKTYKHKLTDDYMRGRGVNPNEFRSTGRKLHDYLKAALEDKDIPTLDYKIALEKFNRMVKKIDIARAKL
jgi:hypothetical protein